MADLRSTIDNIIRNENEITKPSGKVANFAYTTKAYENNDIAGATSYEYNKDQNIPLGTPGGLDSSSVTLNKGYRTMGSSLARMLVNHFFGRCSYNLNKIHDWFKEFLIAYRENIANTMALWNSDTSYSEGDFCFTYLKKHLRIYKALKESKGQQPGIQNGSIWELMNAAWDLRETGNALPTDGNTSMNQLIWPATYKNVRLTGIQEIPKEITSIEEQGNGSYSTVIIERGPGFVKQYIYYVNAATPVGDQSGHYLILRGGLLAEDGQSVTNWTEWEFRVNNANNADKAKDSDSLGTLKAATWESQVQGVKVTNAINADNATNANNLNNNAFMTTGGSANNSVMNVAEFKRRITLSGTTLTINLD